MQLIGDEKRDFKMFKSRHICPDLVPHHDKTLEFLVSYDNGGGIGSNTYIECTRCGCMQDITDYGMW